MMNRRVSPRRIQWDIDGIRSVCSSVRISRVMILAKVFIIYIHRNAPVIGNRAATVTSQIWRCIGVGFEDKAE